MYLYEYKLCCVSVQVIYITVYSYKCTLLFSSCRNGRSCNNRTRRGARQLDGMTLIRYSTLSRLQYIRRVFVLLTGLKHMKNLFQYNVCCESHIAATDGNKSPRLVVRSLDKPRAYRTEFGFLKLFSCIVYFVYFTNYFRVCIFVQLLIMNFVHVLIAYFQNIVYSCMFKYLLINID